MSVVHVAVAVIQNPHNEILIQQRAENTHQGGLWEFPGGKLEKGETLKEALEREIREELGITVNSSRPLIRISHDYGDRSVLLDVHYVYDWSGQVQALEGQPLQWILREKLSDYDMPEADKPIVTALNLPPVYVITPPHIHDAKNFLRILDTLLLQGERLFLYRVKSVQGFSHEELIAEMLSRCKKCNARLLIHEKNQQALVNISQGDFERIGIHLTEEGLMQAESASFSERLLSVSCHSLETLKKAQDINADFAMLSPVETTASHPDTEPLGWESFARIVEQVNLPVYALGGMTKEKTDLAWLYGGQGVAGISSWWKG